MRKKLLELQKRCLRIAQDQQTQLLTNLMAQINQFLAVICNITSKKQTLRKEISCFVFYVLLTQNQLLKGVPYKQGKSL